jgi:hypothetical protein
MPKYQELHQSFVEQSQTHDQEVQECLDLADTFVRNLVQSLEWDNDDIEYVHLTYPIAPSQLHRGRRIDSRRSNKDILERVSYLVDGFWHFGVRLILKARKSRNKEILFVIPLFVKKVGEEIIVKINRQGQELKLEDLDLVANLVANQIESSLAQGALQLLEQGAEGEIYRKFGFLIEADPSAESIEAARIANQLVQESVDAAEQEETSTSTDLLSASQPEIEAPSDLYVPAIALSESSVESPVEPLVEALVESSVESADLPAPASQNGRAKTRSTRAPRSSR